MTAIVSKAGDTVDSICFDYYGYTVGVNELVLEANPGLAKLGAPLPMGTQLTLPAAPENNTQQQNLLQLWD